MSEFKFVRHPPIWIQYEHDAGCTWELWTTSASSCWWVSARGNKTPIPANWEIICVGQPT